MMRSPAERYLQVLFLGGQSAEEVSTVASAKRLDVPAVEYLRQLQVLLQAYLPFDMQNRHARRFVMGAGLHPAFNRDADMQSAMRLLDAPRARTVIESASIARLGPAWIRSALRAERVHVTERAIELYAWFFFDVGLVDASELRATLARRAANDPVLAREYRRDGRVLAAQAPAANLAALLLTLRRGHRPSSFELSRLLDATRTAASVESLNATLRDEPTRAARYAVVAKVAHEMLTDLGDEQEKLRSQLAAIIIETDPEGPPTIGELSGGEHTTQLEPEVLEGGANRGQVVDSAP